MDMGGIDCSNRRRPLSPEERRDGFLHAAYRAGIAMSQEEWQTRLVEAGTRKCRALYSRARVFVLVEGVLSLCPHRSLAKELEHDSLIARHLVAQRFTIKWRLRLTRNAASAGK